MKTLLSLLLSCYLVLVLRPSLNAQRVRRIVLLLLCLVYSSLRSQIPELWGMTRSGGTHNIGSIYKIKGDGSGFLMPVSFDSTNGGRPTSSLMLADNGKLYGASGLGLYGFGTIFSIDPDNNNFINVLQLNGASTANNPFGALIQINNGLLYGTTTHGGTYGLGTLFTFNLSDNSLTIVHDFFDDDHGLAPDGDLVEADNGKLYGMCIGGSHHTTIKIFSLDPANNNAFLNELTVPDSVAVGGDGSFTKASNGKLYAIANGGMYGMGVIFSFDPTDNSAKRLFNFGPNYSGAYPLFNYLTEAGDGKLYGVIPNGGLYFGGTLFSFDISNNTFTKLHDFDTPSGKTPQATLCYASDGKLYGCTIEGGANGFGVIFSFDPANNSYSVIAHGDSTIGFYPIRRLIEHVGPLNISGIILTETSIPVPGVTVVLSGDDTLTSITDSTGTYSFTVEPNGNYTVTPSKRNDIATNNGISSLDILQIRRHILGILPLSSPYKIIAADVDGSSTVTTLDILHTRQMILNMTTTFPNGRLWSFVPSDYVFADMQNPFPFPTSRTYTNLQQSVTGQDFIGIKLGDVNDSWDATIP